jgi:hypothetical protein
MFAGEEKLYFDREWSNYSSFYLITVSGDKANFCGHALLNLGGTAGIYAHIAELNGRPKVMNHSGYDRYLAENGKRELGRLRLFIPAPGMALRKFESLLVEKWIWGGIPNNCYTFVEDIIKSGGGDISKVMNCPKY